MDDNGASCGPGSRPSDQDPKGLDAPRVDPSRVPWPLCGYAPGNYMGTCGDCGGTMGVVDKHARQCLACAVQSAKKGLERLRVAEAERNAFRTQAINRGWNWRMCDAYGREEYERQLEIEVDRTLEVMLGRKTLVESFRDTDGSPEGPDRNGLDGEAATAGAVGIAKTEADHGQ